MINIHDGLLRHALLCVVGGDDIACDKAIRSDIETISILYCSCYKLEKRQLMRRKYFADKPRFSFRRTLAVGLEEDYGEKGWSRKSDWYFE